MGGAGATRAGVIAHANETRREDSFDTIRGTIPVSTVRRKSQFCIVSILRYCLLCCKQVLRDYVRPRVFATLFFANSPNVRALPYTLTPAECGHTFCALCTLKWFFSRLHRSCGSWHESVDCPICRSLLILTPDTTPRTVITVPFTPNRLAGKVIENLVAKLEGGCGLVGSDAKGTKGRACKQPNGCAGKRVKSESRTPGLLTSDTGGNSSLESWAVGGELWKDWRERERYVKSPLFIT